MPNKLIPIADKIRSILHSRFGFKPEYILEHEELEWLTTHPIEKIWGEKWDLICQVYSAITEGIFSLNELSLLDNYIIKNGTHRVDIWFCHPYNFMVEFDEKQHFNQFRLETLNFYSNQSTSFSLDEYKALSTRIIKPGTSGFTKKKKESFLFPYFIPNSDAQDNRIRERAFKDFIKDHLPGIKGFNPTIRIPYTVTHKREKDFMAVDIDAVELYLNKNKFLDRIRVKK